MAKLIFESAEILNSGGSSQGVISNITVDGVEVTLEPDTVNVEDNREIYESYTGRIVIRSKNVNFDGGSDPILASGTSNSTGADYISTDGTLPLEGKIDNRKEMYESKRSCAGFGEYCTAGQRYSRGPVGVYPWRPRG